jgi:hypothetical protein
MQLQRVAGLLGILLALCTFGCQKSPPPKPVQVTGLVVYSNGQPVTGKVITFFPSDDNNSRGVAPTIVLEGKDGRFKVECLPGKYKVTMMPIPIGSGGGPGNIESPPDKDAGKGKETISAKRLEPYRSTNTTPWEVTVLPEGTPEQKLVVQ